MCTHVLIAKARICIQLKVSLLPVLSNCPNSVFLGNVTMQTVVHFIDRCRNFRQLYTHNRFTAGLEYVRVHPGQQVPER